MLDKNEADAHAEVSFGDLDLPSPKAPASTDAGFGELDLPAPRGAVDLPAPKETVDLPQARPRTPFDELDEGLDELDLPMPREPDLPAPHEGFGDIDLPAPMGLPAPVSPQLSSPKGLAPTGSPSAPSTDAFGDLELPIPSATSREPDLPIPRAPGGGSLDLPTPAVAAADLPIPAGGGGGSLDLPTPSAAGVDLPIPSGGGGGALDLPTASGELPAVSMPGGGSLDLPIPSDIPGGLEADIPTDGGRGAPGGVQFGEIDLGAEEPSDEMEFADIPQERDSLSARADASEPSLNLAEDNDRAKDEAKRRREARGKAAQDKPKRSKAVFVLLGFVLVVVGVGFGLGYTDYGYFGLYALEQFLPEAGDDATVNTLVTNAEETAATDSYLDVRQSLRQLSEGRREMGLHRGLLARSVLHEALFQVRFGEDSASASRIAAILRRIDDRGGDAPGIGLARAAVQIVEGSPDLAMSSASAVVGDPYAQLVMGEAALRLAADADAEQAETHAAAAIEAFTGAGETVGARGTWGLVRAHLAAGNTSEAAAAIDQTLELSPRHAGALAAKARVVWQAGDTDEALRLARTAAGAVPLEEERVRSSKADRAAAWSLVGEIEESAGNRGQARRAYERALEADPFRAASLLGAGRLLLRDGRYREALTRFQAVIEGNLSAPTAPGERPSLVEAHLGAARAMMEVGQVQEARAKLQALGQEYPDDAEIILYLGKVEEAAENRGAAEANYLEAIRLAPEEFAGYLALSQLYFTLERPTDAAAKLAQARERVPESSEMRRMLGESELARNNLAAAETEYRRAVELDGSDLSSRFGLAVTLRRAGKLNEAAEVFDSVGEADPSWPGLSLERGLLFEAEGRGERAVEAYQKALEEQPGDVDLLLRLGAAYVSAGRIDEAEETLQQVSEERPNSAETQHFMGRVAFARDELREAQAYLDRAVDLDGSRGEFHLYAGWVALELGNLGTALDAVESAIERDPSLGDAYWLRGRVQVRTGAVQRALEDLSRALELKPSRYEAYATMGECYDQLRRLSDAVASYERALEQDSSRGRWWWRLGTLRIDAGQRSEAGPALERAVGIGEEATSTPSWLADAYRLSGDVARQRGERQQAVAHYRRYLELAPESDIDRREVQDRLEDLER